MPGSEFIAALAGALVAGSLVVFAAEALKFARSARQRPTTAMVTVRNDEGERVEVNLDPNDDESVRRFFEVVDTIKHDDRSSTKIVGAEARTPTLTLG